MKANFRGVLALFLALTLILTQTGPALAADTAAAMKLSKVEGTVTVTNASSRELSIRDDMRLYNGYTVKTSAASYAWINLDDAKLIKLDASTEVEVRKSGSKLEVLLKSGSIYGDVSKPLESSESLNVRTSTAIVGIRGTKFQVRRTVSQTLDAALGQFSAFYESVTLVSVMEGRVSLTTQKTDETSAAPGETGDAAVVTQTEIISAGETAAVTASEAAGTAGEATAASISVSVTSIQQQDLTGSTQTELTSGGDYSLDASDGSTIILTRNGAAGRKAADEQAAREMLEAAWAMLQKQAGAGEDDASKDNVWDDAGGSTGPTGAGTSGGTAPSLPDVEEPAPGPGPEEPNPGPGTEESTEASEPSAEEPTEPSEPSTEESTDEPSTEEPTEEPSEEPIIPDIFTVSFDSQGGSDVDSQDVVSGETASLPADAPVKDGYQFQGWYTGPPTVAFSAPYDFSTPVTEDLTLYAWWTVMTYQVDFETDGGTAVDSQSVTYGHRAAEPAEPTKMGYSFAGWYTDSGLTTAYDFSAPVTEDLTLYACWTVMAYQVDFETDGGTAVDSQTVTYGQQAEEPDEPTKTGYSFAGWYTDGSFTTAYDFSTPVTEDLILYANWEEETVLTLTLSENNKDDLDALVDALSSGCYDKVVLEGGANRNTLYITGDVAVPENVALELSNCSLDVGLVSAYSSSPENVDMVADSGTLTVNGSLQGSINSMSEWDNKSNLIVISETGTWTGESLFLQKSELENNGTVTLSSGLSMLEGSLTNNKEMTVASNSSSNGTITNSGTLINEGTLVNEGTFINAAGSTFNNEGIFSTSNSGVSTNSGVITNSGTIEVGAGSTFSSEAGVVNNYGTYNNYGGTSISGASTFVNYSGGIINVDGAAGGESSSFASCGTFTNREGGVINSTGTINFFDDDTGGSVTNGGDINNEAGGQLMIQYYVSNTGTIFNGGETTISGDIDNNGTITNSGTLTVEATTADGGGLILGQINNWGTLDNSGDITNNGCILNENGSVINNAISATITNELDSRIENFSGGSINNEGNLINNGAISNDGTYTGPAVAGTISGGNADDMLNGTTTEGETP